MSWFKVDDGFHKHRKRRAAGGLEAIGLWTLCGSWSSDALEDGFVPAEQVRAFALTRADRLASALEDAGLFEPVTKHGEPGWQMHDFGDYNPTADSVIADRKAAAERQRRAREAAKAKRDAERSGEVTPDVTENVTPDVTRDSRQTFSVSHGPPDPTRPVSTSLGLVSPSPPVPERASQNGGGGIGEITEAVQAIRPEWTAQAIHRALGEATATHPWPHTAAAMLAVANDPTSTHPGRLTHPGPWWTATRPRTPDKPIVRCASHHLPQPCISCAADRKATA